MGRLGKGNKRWLECVVTAEIPSKNVVKGVLQRYNRQGIDFPLCRTLGLMSKFFIVCPNCKARYAVADRNIAGKAVTCKKCSQKFAAKIYTPAPAKEAAPVAAASAEPDLFGASDNDPFDSSGSDDLFGDMPTSSSEGPALASLPPAKRKGTSSSGSLPIVPIVLAGGGLVLVVVLVIVGISIANSLGDSTGGGFPSNSSLAGNNEQANFDRHHEVLDTQIEQVNRFIAAIESINGEEDIPRFVSTVGGLADEVRRLATKVEQLPPVSKESNAKLSEEAERRVKAYLPRMKAAGQKIAQYNRMPGVKDALLDFQSAGNQLSGALSSARRRLSNASSRPSAPSSQSTAGTPGTSATADAKPTVSPSGKPLTEFQSKHGFENSVMFLAPSISHEQTLAIVDLLKPHMVDTHYSMNSNSVSGAKLEINYNGDVNALLPHVTFGEVEKVDEEERLIYLKSVTLETE